MPATMPSQLIFISSLSSILLHRSPSTVINNNTSPLITQQPSSRNQSECSGQFSFLWFFKIRFLASRTRIFSRIPSNSSSPKNVIIGKKVSKIRLRYISIFSKRTHSHFVFHNCHILL